MLHRAVLDDDYDTAATLLKAGSRADVQDNHGNTPLHNACYHGSTRAVSLLLSYESSHKALNVRTTEGDSPLDYACSNHHVEVAELLVKAGADINSADSRGWTTLHNACASDHRNAMTLVFFLLDAGADPNIPNSDGQLPIDLTSNHSVRTMLRRKMEAIEADQEFLEGGVEF